MFDVILRHRQGSFFLEVAFSLEKRVCGRRFKGDESLGFIEVGRAERPQNLALSNCGAENFGHTDAEIVRGGTAKKA